MKYLHQVSLSTRYHYLRLQDVIGVCLSYCCLSGTTPGIISAFARCNWCVPIILLSIRYNVCTCRSPIYCCLSGTTCIPVIVQYITTSLLQHVYCLLYHSCVCRSYVIIELVSPKDEVCWKSKNTCLKSGLIRNTYTRYHICLMRVFIILLSSNISLFTLPLLLSTSHNVS